MGIVRDACRFLVLYKGSLRVLGLRLRALELRVVGFGLPVSQCLRAWGFGLSGGIEQVSVLLLGFRSKTGTQV